MGELHRLYSMSIHPYDLPLDPRSDPRAAIQNNPAVMKVPTCYCMEPTPGGGGPISRRREFSQLIIGREWEIGLDGCLVSVV